mgnify:CR=1 FL=1
MEVFTMLFPYVILGSQVDLEILRKVGEIFMIIGFNRKFKNQI